MDHHRDLPAAALILCLKGETAIPNQILVCKLRQSGVMVVDDDDNKDVEEEEEGMEEVDTQRRWRNMAMSRNCRHSDQRFYINRRIILPT